MPVPDPLHIGDWVSWKLVASALNSAFTTSLLGALAGAYAGARAAQALAERSKSKELLLTELRSTNAAIMLAFSICNSGLTLKRQFVSDIVKAYSASKATHQNHKEQLRIGAIPRDHPFELHLDLRVIQMPQTPIAELRGLVYEKLSVSGLPLLLTATLSGVLQSLEGTVSNRTMLVERLRSLQGDERKQLVPLYLGLPFSDGQRSTEFEDTVNGLAALTDDTIFFSNYLLQQLRAYGHERAQAYKRTFGKQCPSIHSVDLHEAKAAGLIPPDSQYAEWLRGVEKLLPSKA